ncbi:Cys-Gln thioester bond-forming surface protein [Streptococcus halichoeri]|uniref:Cys-Gln thioester bond-forming surface protein n=1 Tax=Streptococcus halichoeri TaxID=254785 RepID=UPI0022A712C0|nr:TQXA domain-containing protein [Streptococcus halichoeri]
MKRKILIKILLTPPVYLVLPANVTKESLYLRLKPYFRHDLGTKAKSSFLLQPALTHAPKHSSKAHYVVYYFKQPNHHPDSKKDQTTFQGGQDKAFFNRLLVKKGPQLPATVKKKANRTKTASAIEKALLSVLQRGYPTVKKLKGLDEKSSHKVTLLALWHFSHHLKDPDTILTTKLSKKERAAFDYLIHGATHAPPTTTNQTSDSSKRANQRPGKRKHCQNILRTRVMPPKEKPSQLQATSGLFRKAEQRTFKYPESVAFRKTGHEQAKPKMHFELNSPKFSKKHMPKYKELTAADLRMIIGGDRIYLPRKSTSFSLKRGIRNSPMFLQPNKTSMGEQSYDALLSNMGCQTRKRTTKVSDIMAGSQGQPITTFGNPQSEMVVQADNISNISNINSIQKPNHNTLNNKISKQVTLPQTKEKKQLGLFSLMGAVTILLIPLLPLFKRKFKTK